MKIAKLLLATGFMFVVSQTAQAQEYYETSVQPSATEANAHTSEIDKSYNERGDRYIPVDFNLQFKNMHLWRGLEVSSSALTAVDVYFKDRQDMFHIGLWGGAAFNGKFKEFDYYVSFQKKGFQVAVWDIYNFSPGATYNNKEVFNYKNRYTGHFIDLSLAYRFQGNFPLNIGWATVFFGRDRNSLNTFNRYSTYVFADYPIYRGGFVDLDLGAAAAFALKKEEGSKANFYAHKGGIVNANFTVSKKIRLGRNYVLPVSAMVMWNPTENYANIQLAINIF